VKEVENLLVFFCVLQKLICLFRYISDSAWFEILMLDLIEVHRAK